VPRLPPFRALALLGGLLASPGALAATGAGDAAPSAAGAAPSPAGPVPAEAPFLSPNLPPPPESPPPPPEPPRASTAKVEATSVLGRKVVAPGDTKFGQIVDVLVDAAGQPRAAVIEFGGFMGVGERQIAVDWSVLRFPPPGSDEAVSLGMTADQFRDVPAYTPASRPVTVVGPPADARKAP